MTRWTIFWKSAVAALRQKAFFAAFLILTVMAFSGTAFYTAANLINLINSISVLTIIAFGVTLVLVAGGCDLSIGGTMVIAGIVAIKLINAGLPIPIAIAVALGCGALIGSINAFFSVYQKTEPFIVTLGMSMLLTGLAQELTDAHPVPCFNPSFALLANGKLFDQVPYLVLVMVAFLLLFSRILNSTSFGRNCYAIGGDYLVAEYSGIPVLRIKAATYVICGLTAAIGGVMLSSLLNSGSSIYGDNTALIVNCGVVVGGTSFAGGIGGVWQSTIGLLMFGLLQNGMDMLRIDAYIQLLIQGLVIVGIIWMDCYSRRRKLERR
jgi:ribose transport system permease protein